MQWLSGTFLGYLEEWEKEIKKVPGLTATEQNKLLLSRETRQGLRITGEQLHDCIASQQFDDMTSYYYLLPL